MWHWVIDNGPLCEEFDPLLSIALWTEEIGSSTNDFITQISRRNQKLEDG